MDLKTNWFNWQFFLGYVLSEYNKTHIIPTQTLSKKVQTKSFLQAWEEETLALKDDTVITDKLDRYIAEGIINIGTSTALKWRTDKAQRTQLPSLSRMAIDLPLVPATSVEVERLFSSSKLTISDKRNSLIATTIEAVKCLESWF